MVFIRRVTSSFFFVLLIIFVLKVILIVFRALQEFLDLLECLEKKELRQVNWPCNCVSWISTVPSSPAFLVPPNFPRSSSPLDLACPILKTIMEYGLIHVTIIFYSLFFPFFALGWGRCPRNSWWGRTNWGKGNNQPITLGAYVIYDIIGKC